MATVYLAEDVKHHRQVAIKLPGVQVTPAPRGRRILEGVVLPRGVG